MGPWNADSREKKRILADDDQENSRTEDTLPSNVASQVILEVDNSADDGIVAGQADGDVPSKENDYKDSKRRQNLSLYSEKLQHRVHKIFR